jgi:hypothetical protein
MRSCALVRSCACMFMRARDTPRLHRRVQVPSYKAYTQGQWGWPHGFMRSQQF